MVWWIIIAWLVVGWLTWRWQYVWEMNYFTALGVKAFPTIWWIIFHAFILLGPLYLAAWALSVMYQRVFTGTSLLGKS